MAKKKTVLILTIIFLFFSFNLLIAREFHVTNGNGFQEALTEAAENDEDDTIFMAEGIYQRINSSGVHYANFEYETEERHSIAIIGEPGTSSSDVIIDANNSGFCLQISSSIIGPYEDFIGEIYVSGIKFQNGNAAECSSGLHIYAQDFRVIINNCEIMNNTTYSCSGGGVQIISKSVCIENNKILFNTSHDFREFDYIYNVEAGGLYVQAGYSSFLRNNIIAYNSTISDTGETICRGGGVYIIFFNAIDESLSLINNTIYGNEADYGGGIYINGVWGSRLNLYNNIIYNNTANTSGGGNDIYSRYGATRIYSHNNNYSDFVYEIIDESSDNLNIEPRFVNALTGNFHLSFTSPMIGAGTNVAPTPPGLPEYDIDGYDRIYGTTVDIGADEFSLVINVQLPFKARIIIMDIVEPEMHIRDVGKLKMKGMVFNENNEKGEIWILQVSKEGIKYFTKNNVWTTEKSVFYQGVIEKQTEIEISKFVISKTGLYDFYIIADKKIDGKISPDSFVIDSKTLLILDDKQ